MLHGLSYGVASTINLALYLDGGIADRRRAMTWYTFAVTLGFLVGNFVGGVFGDQVGYPAAYTVSGVLALVAIVLLFWERQQAGPSPGGPPPVARPAAARGLTLGAPLVAALADPKIASVALVAFAIAFYFQLGASFFPLYGISVGLSLTELGLIRSSQSLMMVVFTPLATWPMRWWGHRKTSYFALMAQCGVLMLVPALPQFWSLLPLFSTNGAVRGIMNTANAVSLAEDVDESRVSRGMASSIFNAGKDLGNISSPFIAGFVASAIGLSALFAIVPPLTMVVVLSVVALLVLKERRRVAQLAIEPQA
jgi:MFS family permease